MMALVLPVALSAPLALAAPTGAAVLGECDNFSQSLQQGVNTATGEGNNRPDCNVAGGTSNEEGIAELARTIVNYLSIIVGVVAVIMIIVGGFRYITSGGDSGNVSTAKNTLIYAIVGLIIVALAQFIVRFVLGATSNIS